MGLTQYVDLLEIFQDSVFIIVLCRHSSEKIINLFAWWAKYGQMAEFSGKWEKGPLDKDSTAFYLFFLSKVTILHIFGWFISDAQNSIV